MNSNKIRLGYWKARGRGEVARQLLTICGQQWDETSYSDPKQWFQKDKQQLGLPLPNLPYLIDGDLKLTQSVAIYRHILRRFGKREYLGRSINDEAIVDSLTSISYDIDQALIHLFWDPEWKSKLEQRKKVALPKLKKINQLYGNRVYALDYPTLPDFLFAEVSYYIERILPDDYKNYPFLGRLRAAISQIPDIKLYYKQKGSLAFVEEGDLKF